MRREISFTDLPHAAQKLISKQQQSYIDEFVFIQDETSIEAFYADKLLCIWYGSQWIHSPFIASRVLLDQDSRK
jgi:hypothetical protein